MYNPDAPKHFSIQIQKIIHTILTPKQKPINFQKMKEQLIERTKRNDTKRGKERTN